MSDSESNDKRFFLKWCNNIRWREVNGVDVRCVAGLTEEISEEDKKYLVDRGEIYFDDNIYEFDDEENENSEDSDDYLSWVRYKVSEIHVDKSIDHIYILLLIGCESCEFNEYVTKLGWYESRDEAVNDAMEWIESEISYDQYDESPKKVIKNIKKHFKDNDGIHFIGCESGNDVGIFKVPLHKPTTENKSEELDE